MPELFSPDSVEEFMTLKLPEPGTFRASPADVTQMNLHLEHLKDLQEHLSQYREFLDKPQMRITRERIREYAAQDNAKGERVFFKHAAVDKVEIYCKFPNTDVKALRLIDLPGLGDTRIGDVERVVSALSDQVDLVFFLSKPSKTGAAWQDNEIHLYSQAKRALGEKLPIEDWSFWVFNHDSRPGAENMPQCELMKKYMSGAQIKVSDSVIADCTDSDDVSHNLIDKALAFLAENIERNDLNYAYNIQELLKKLMSDIRDITDRAERLLRETSNSEREDDCIPFKNSIETILSSEEEADSVAGYADFIKRASNRAGGLQTAHEEAMHRLRTGLGARLQKDLDDTLNQVLIDMKNEICEILADTGKLDKVFGFRDYRLLHEITGFIEKSGFKEDVPALDEGFSLLANWSMNYRSFIQHRLRSALNRLDPLDMASREYGNPFDAEESVTLLESLYHETINEIRRAFSDIYSEPNKAAFAAAEEFKDIVIRSSAEGNRKLETQCRTFLSGGKGHGLA